MSTNVGFDGPPVTTPATVVMGRAVEALGSINFPPISPLNQERWDAWLAVYMTVTGESEVVAKTTIQLHLNRIGELRAAVLDAWELSCAQGNLVPYLRKRRAEAMQAYYAYVAEHLGIASGEAFDQLTKWHMLICERCPSPTC